MSGPERRGSQPRFWWRYIEHLRLHIARQVAPDALSVSYVTALGTDSFSQQMLEARQGENVGTSLIQRMENRLPGLFYIETDSTGERTFYYWRNEAAAKFCWKARPPLPFAKNWRPSIISAQAGSAPRSRSRRAVKAAVTAARMPGPMAVRVIFDNNYRRVCGVSPAVRDAAGTRQMLECTDIAFLTLDDEDALWGEKTG